VGAGNGLNFAHYPPTVTEVVAIEPEPTLRAIAQQAAAGAPVPVTVRAGTADALALADGEMDAAVASLVLCSVPDQARALAELHRVLRPGAELRFYEHVIARCQPMRTILRLADRSGDRRRLSPRARHQCRHRGRRLHDRALRTIRLSRQRARAQRPAHPRHRTTTLRGGRLPALDRGLAKLSELSPPRCRSPTPQVIAGLSQPKRVLRPPFGSKRKGSRWRDGAGQPPRSLHIARPTTNILSAGD
jgi:SAM-dependent methyltransferase